MNTITKHVVLLILCLSLSNVYAQDTIQKSKIDSKIEDLLEMKKSVEKYERDFLKSEIEEINMRLDKGEINQDQADQLKKEAAQKRALNIENRLAIIDNKIELLKRNENEPYVYNWKRKPQISLGADGVQLHVAPPMGKDSIPYDRRTTTDIVFAFGANMSIIEGQSLDDSPYMFGSGSSFVELGIAGKTRVLKNSNAIRLKYGVSLQWNKLRIKDDQYFVEENDWVTLQPFEYNLNKAKFRMTNLVVPVHFEFGPSKKVLKDNYFRYSTDKQFKIGIGGYAGFNVETLQKLKYKVDGDRVKDKIRRNYNTSDFVYGISGYIGVGDLGIYAKYDLSPIFKDQPVDQNNLSIGLCLNLD